MQFFKHANVNFIGNRKYAFMFSGALTLIFIFSIIVRGGFNLSIDFKGGTMIQLKFQKSIQQEIGKIRSLVGNLNIGSPEIKTIGNPSDNEIQIIVKKRLDNMQIGEQIRAAITKGLPDNSFEVRREDQVGPKIGSELTMNMVIAILLSSIALIIYMGFRFKLPYGVAAIVATLHDVVVALTFFVMFDWEISIPVIAALLTLMGYSMNDTIVVFDRIRENFTGNVKSGFEQTINNSINQTLSRTVITSLLTLFSMVALYLFFINTDDVMKYFAVALVVGIITGTYSSIFIASPILIVWNKRWPIKNF